LKGNFVFLNLFLAILLDGFTHNDAEQELADELEERKDPDIKFLKGLEKELKDRSKVHITKFA